MIDKIQNRSKNRTVTISAKVSKDVAEYLEKLVSHTKSSKSEIIKSSILNSVKSYGDIHKEKNRLEELYLLNQISIKLEKLSAYCSGIGAVDIGVLNQLKVIEDILIMKQKNDL